MGANMKKPAWVAAGSAALFVGALSGCGVPHYNVPYTPVGTPSVLTIVQRVECELLEQVQDGSQVRSYLLTGDYQVAVTLSLDVTDSGGLAPSLAYIDPVASLTLGGSGTLSQSRDNNFTENMQFSLRRIRKDWDDHLSEYRCPDANTNLAGTLGIGDFVAMAFGSQGLADQDASKSPFGGSIQFVVTKSASGVGPIWSLVRFKGPGGVNLSEVNTDKLTFAFAKGKNRGKPFVVENGFNNDAYLFLQQLLNSSINNQLLNLQYFNQNAAPSWLNLLPLH